MRRYLVDVLLFCSLALAVWITGSPSAGQLHYAFTHYDKKDLTIQMIYVAAAVIISFGGGWLFRRKK